MRIRLFFPTFALFLAVGLLRADDARPVVDASKVPFEKIANAALPTLFIVGDSTVRSGGVDGKVGWGECLAPFFDTNKINVVNRAIGGRSARTFFTEGRWQQVADALKPGDFVIIQFGHNDQGRIGAPANKHRADGRGIGDETVPDIMLDGSTEQVHTFGWYMAKFVTDAKARGATVILCSPIPHKQRWEKGRDFADVAKWDAEVAKEHGARFFDLTMVITDAYKKIGMARVETFFADKGTHTTKTGAQFNAACVVAGLKSLSGNPLGKFLSDQAEEIEAYKPAAAGATTAPTNHKFYFGGTANPGWTAVAPTNVYSPETGFGFEPGAKVVAGENSISSNRPCYFYVKITDGCAGSCWNKSTSRPDNPRRARSSSICASRKFPAAGVSTSSRASRKTKVGIGTTS
jgi:lysophospholipase L1-like esterase